MLDFILRGVGYNLIEMLFRGVVEEMGVGIKVLWGGLK
jgi:hypothetical protein